MRSFSISLRRAGLIGLLATASLLAQAQQTPARVYPPAEPSAADSANNAPQLRDKKQFANQSVLGMGPSKGLIVRYERVPINFQIKSVGTGGVPDYTTDVRAKTRCSRPSSTPHCSTTLTSR